MAACHAPHIKQPTPKPPVNIAASRRLINEVKPKPVVKPRPTKTRRKPTRYSLVHRPFDCRFDRKALREARIPLATPRAENSRRKRRRPRSRLAVTPLHEAQITAIPRLMDETKKKDTQAFIARNHPQSIWLCRSATRSASTKRRKGHSQAATVLQA